MAAIRSLNTQSPGNPSYHVVDAHGLDTAIYSGGGTMVIANGNNKIVLTKANVADLYAVITAFNNNGVIT